MTLRRRGSFVGGTWLIGLGVAFLAHEISGRAWSETWPMFIVLIGVAKGIATVTRWRPSLGGLWDFTWPVAWTALGLILLGSTLGAIASSPLELVDVYWPWAAIVLGGWFILGALVPDRVPPPETLAVPLAGVEIASVRITFGAGRLDVAAATPGLLVDGDFSGGVVQRDHGPGDLELSQDTTYGLPGIDGVSTWTVGLTTEVPLDLRAEVGAARATFDLRSTRLRRLELKTGASETRVLLPRSAGATTVRAESGAADMTLEVPAGVAARIRSRMALGSVRIDEARFPRVGDVYESVDFAGAVNRIEIDVQGGLGSVRIVGTE